MHACFTRKAAYMQLLGAAHLGFKYGQGKNGNVRRDTRQGAKNRTDIRQIGAHSRLDESEQGAGLHFGLGS